MEMQDPAVRQTMEMQARMLQQMQMMQSQQNMQSYYTAPPAFVGGFGAQMFNPSQYGAASPSMPPNNLGYSEGTPAADARQGLFGQLWNNYINYNPLRQSKEGRAEFWSQQNRMVQENVLNSITPAAQGAAGVGSLMLPGGFIASMAGGAAIGAVVAGGTKLMADGGRLAMDYEDTLRRKAYTFVSPYGSTSETGEIGFSRRENQDLASFLRHVGPEKFMEDQDIKKILDGAMDNRLMKSTSDVESFKKRFSGLVDAVKQITVTMNESIEEAMKFMGELERRGINQRDMPMFAAQSRIAGSSLGISASAAGQQLLQSVDSVTSGTAINAGVAMRTSAQNQYLTGFAYGEARDKDPNLYSYISNNGGPGQSAAMVEQTIRQYIGQNGSGMLLGLLGSGFDKGENGEFSVNGARMRQLINGDMSAQQMTSASNNAMRGLSSADQYALSEQASTLLQNFAGPTEQYDLVNLMVRQMRETSGQNISAASALTTLGLASGPEQAKLIARNAELMGNKQFRQGYQALTLKEQLDAVATTESPSLPQRVGFAWERFANRIGDGGQAITDSISNSLSTYEKWATGIGDRSRTLGGVYDLTQAGYEKVFNNQSVDGINTFLDSMQSFHVAEVRRKGGEGAVYTERLGGWETGHQSNDYRDGKIKMSDLNGLADTASRVAGRFSQGQFDSTMSMLDRGEMSGTALAQLADRYRGSDLNFGERRRMEYIMNTASGDYSGFGGTFKQVGAQWDLFSWKAVDSAVEVRDWAFDKTGINKNRDNSSGTMAYLEKARDELQSSSNDAEKDVAKFMMQGSAAVGTDQFMELERSIKLGDVDKVTSLTANQKAKELAQRYKGMVDKSKSGAASVSDLEKATKWTTAIAHSTTNLESLLVHSGAMTKQEAHGWMSPAANVATEALAGIGEKSMTLGDLAGQSQVMLKAQGEMIDKLSPEVLQKLAGDLIKTNQVAPEALLTASGTVDKEKMKAAIATTLGKIESDNTQEVSQKGGSKTDGKEVAGALGEHQDLMKDVLTGIQNESKMMRQALDGKPVQQPPKIKLGNAGGMESKAFGFFGF